MDAILPLRFAGSGLIDFEIRALLVGFEGLGIQSEGPAMKGRVKMPRLELARWMSLLFTAVVH